MKMLLEVLIIYEMVMVVGCEFGKWIEIQVYVSMWES